MVSSDNRLFSCLLLSLFAMSSGSQSESWEDFCSSGSEYVPENDHSNNLIAFSIRLHYSGVVQKMADFDCTCSSNMHI